MDPNNIIMWKFCEFWCSLLNQTFCFEQKHTYRLFSSRKYLQLPREFETKRKFALHSQVLLLHIVFKYVIRREYPNLLELPAVVNIAKAHSRTPAQVLLRFLLQHGVAVIPKSTDASRIKQVKKYCSFEHGAYNIINVPENHGYRPLNIYFIYLH